MDYFTFAAENKSYSYIISNAENEDYIKLEGKYDNHAIYEIDNSFENFESVIEAISIDLYNDGKSRARFHAF